MLCDVCLFKEISEVQRGVSLSFSVKENQREEEEDKRGGASPRSFATSTREHFFNSRFIASRVSCCVVHDSFARVLQMWIQVAINPLHGREIGFNALNKFLSKSLPWEETLSVHITLYHHVSA